MTVLIAASWTIAAIVGGVLIHDAWHGVALMAGVMAIVTIHTRSHQLAVQMMRWTAPLLLMMVLVHGVLSPLYPVASHILGTIPIRPDGLLKAVHTTSAITALMLAVSTWTLIPNDDLIDDLIRMRLPTIIVVLAGQSVATIRLLQRRATAVFLAQQSRGIPVQAGTLSRVRALPSVFLPTVTAALVDADIRAKMLSSRGLAVTRMTVLRPRSVSAAEILAAASLPAFIVALSLVLHE